MKDLKGTETEKNLNTAFAGESEARNKYDWWASRAKKDGYEQIADFFSVTANNEKEHAKVLFMTQRIIWPRQLLVKTMSGQKCTKSSLTLLKRKASLKSLKRCVVLPRSKANTKSATESC